uniref:Putative glutathione s-transferase c-terminal domain protein n=2 Tax=Triatoma infestans TaxID=30076 RepID=A0A023EZI3_TRIIF
MGHVYLEISSLTAGSVQAPVETALCLCVYDYLGRPSQVNLRVVIVKQTSPQLSVDINGIAVSECTTIPSPASYCSLPVFQADDSLSCVAGLSAVLRQIVRCSEASNHHLLGFRKACLVSCAETSVWTKFCEIELIASCKKIMNDEYNNVEEGILPLEMARLESHMSLPIRVHNVGKLKDRSHKYAEGPHFLLTDLVLALPVHIMLNTIGFHNCSLIPLILAWYLEVAEKQNYMQSLSLLQWEQFERWKSQTCANWILPTVVKQSLYKRDPTRYKPRNKIYTQQVEIEDSMNRLENVDLIEYTEGPSWEEEWADDLPIPEVPSKRLIRKRHQLANLAAAAISITSEGDTLVDFCSGSGHLGIILAHCLPKCTVILLDNKEKSLDRARQRLKSLNLYNVYVIQTNLDYFIGTFQVGVSLHACGVASDLVIHKCLQNKANFVVCPCCYGGIQENHIISYPQSQEYMNAGLTQRGYIVLGHCADQAGSDQGEKGMRAVDSDRCLLARNRGYYVTLSKLIPHNCTTRNNIIIGVKPKQQLIVT